MRLDLSAIEEPARRPLALHAEEMAQDPATWGSERFWLAVVAALEAPDGAAWLHVAGDAAAVGEMKRAAGILWHLLDGRRSAAAPHVYEVMSALDDEWRALDAARLAADESLLTGAPPPTGELVPDEEDQQEPGPRG